MYKEETAGLHALESRILPYIFNDINLEHIVPVPSLRSELGAIIISWAFQALLFLFALHFDLNGEIHNKRPNQVSAPQGWARGVPVVPGYRGYYAFIGRKTATTNETRVANNGDNPHTIANLTWAKVISHKDAVDSPDNTYRQLLTHLGNKPQERDHRMANIISSFR